MKRDAHTPVRQYLCPMPDSDASPNAGHLCGGDRFGWAGPQPSTAILRRRASGGSHNA